MTEARPSDYWISNTALYIQLNAVGDYDYIHANCSTGSKVMCYMRAVDGLGYDNAHNYRRWDLKASPTVFHDSKERYVYIAIPKPTSKLREAQIVFPSERIDIYGCDSAGNQIAGTDCYYIFTQGIISSSIIGGVQKPREWKAYVDTGSLASDEAIANGGESSWWRWDSITDTIVFIKDILSATFRNITAYFAKINQLSLADHLINGIADENTPDDADDKLLTPKSAGDKYLSKTHHDRTPYNLNVGGKLTAEDGAHFGEFVSGELTGKGGAVDAAGNGELESLVLRSYLKVMELIYNRLNAQEGDTTFSDLGTIESVTIGDDGSVVVEIRKRWDGDFTAFQPGDIVYGYVNNLHNAGWKEYYKAWAWIKSVDRANNLLTVVSYPDAEVPSGRNHPLVEGMMITRWGNVIEASAETYSNPDYTAVIGKHADGSYYNKRQRIFYISTDEGNLVELMGVNKPIIEKNNYATILGTIPEGLFEPGIDELINKDQPYLYARGILVQDLIRIGYEGMRTRTPNYRGWWDEGMARSESGYYRSTAEVYDEVTWDGALWQCIVAHADADPPSELSASWIKMTAAISDRVVNLWTIIPSANIVSLRSDVVVPSRLSCSVNLNSNIGPETFTSNIDLFEAGAKLYYSLDDLTWDVFVIGESEPLELEDGSGLIEMEDSEDGNLILTLGGDDIDTSAIGDRIYFELRAADDDNVVLAKTQVPVVKDGERGAFTSTVFIRTNEEPYTPSGGSYDKPVPTSEPAWSDGIPSGQEILWASTRVFRDNVETAWSVPRQMTDTATFDVQFSDVDENPGTPDSEPQNWFDPDADKDTKDFTRMLWKAEKYCKNDLWSDWVIVRIKGEKGEDGKSGDWTSYVFKDNPVKPDRPVDTEHTIPDGWVDAPGGEGRWWMSMAVIDATTGKPGEWSDPIPASGVDGVDGADGNRPVLKFRVYSEDEIPLSIVTTDRHPAGWSDRPPSIDPGYALWMIQATVDSDDNLVGEWSNPPVRISGEKGEDAAPMYLWSIIPNATIVSVRKDSVEPAKLTASVSLNTNVGSPVEYTSNIDLYEMGCQLFYSVDGINWEIFVIGDYEPLELEDESGLIELEDSEDGSQVLIVGGDDINTATIGDRIYFELRSLEDDAILASTQVPVVKDGDGLPGRDGLLCYPAGIFDSNVKYEATTETTPVVMYEKIYYRLKYGKSYRGLDADTDRNTPAKDVAKSDDQTVWVVFDMFNSVFADIIMANFGKLGQAVFYGGWMISQEGTINGLKSDKYQLFKSEKDTFIPNFSVNFKTGEVRAADGYFSGGIKAQSLSLGVERLSDQYSITDLPLLTQALNVTTGGYYALPALAPGTSRVIEVIVMGLADIKKTNQFFSLYGNDKLENGNLVMITTQCDIANAKNSWAFADRIDNDGYHHYVQGLYRCLGWRLAENDASEDLTDEQKATTYWNVIRMDDATEVAQKVIGSIHEHPETPPGVSPWIGHVEDDDYIKKI